MNIHRYLTQSEIKSGEVIDKSDIGYDKRHKLNTADGVTPNITLEDLNAGVSYEKLKALNVPVYEYKTQVTIHGQFPDMELSRVIGYKCLIQNKNKSIGVRWIAIDGEKKRLIRDCLYYSKTWQFYANSQGVELSKRFAISDLENAKAVYKSIPDIYFGTKFAVKLDMFGLIYLCIEFDGIMVENLWAFIDYLTEGKIKSQSVLDAFKETERIEQAKKDELYRIERAKEQAVYDAKKQTVKAMLESIGLKAEPLAIGKRYIRLNIGSYTGDYKVVEVYKTRFGKVCIRTIKSTADMNEAKAVLNDGKVYESKGFQRDIDKLVGYR